MNDFIPGTRVGTLCEKCKSRRVLLPDIRRIACRCYHWINTDFIEVSAVSDTSQLQGGK